MEIYAQLNCQSFNKSLKKGFIQRSVIPFMFEIAIVIVNIMFKRVGVFSLYDT